jgi:hypothetical protein
VPSKVIAQKVIHNYDSHVLDGQGHVNDAFESHVGEGRHEDAGAADQEGRKP